MKTLVIVESPVKAQKIQDYLGKNYVVMASKGHITDLAKGGKNNLGVDIDNNFKPKYVLMDDKIDTLNALLGAAKKCDQIFLASDPDREGEAIAWHLAQRLDGVNVPIKRMVFNEIKKDKLLKAVKQVRDIDMNLFHSQEARRILDRIVGFMASPFLMNNFGPKLSAGRVQSVVTRMIIDREKEIDVFVPEEFWTLQVNLSKDGKEGFTMKYSGRPTDSKSAEEIRVKLADNNPEYIVTDVVAAEEKVAPPAPLVTSSLQRIMSKMFGFSADRTMKAAQSLYESGYCTYIRTDSVRVGDEGLAEVRDWITNNGYELPKKYNVHKNKNSAQDAHECIRPSDLALDPSNNMAIINSDEKQVYETIWRYFIASQMTPAVYNTLKVTAHVKGKPEAEVKASGKTLIKKGFMEILGLKDDSQIEIPNLSVKDVLHLFGKSPVKVEKKQTQPPPRFSEDKLIKELEMRNIGRPATYAELLTKITARNYVEKKGNIFYPTELGKKITNILIDYFTFMDYDYTAKMEEQLDEIESGNVDHVDMLKKFYPKFQTELNKAYTNYGANMCDKCGSPMVVRLNKQNKQKFLACSAYPKCYQTKPINDAS